MAKPRVTVLTDTTRAVEHAFAMFTGPLQCAAVSPPAARTLTGGADGGVAELNILTYSAGVLQPSP